MGILAQFAQRKRAQNRTDVPAGDDDKAINELAAGYPLSSGQSTSIADSENPEHDPWSMYFDFAEQVAIPQMTEMQQTLQKLNQSTPGQMLPEPGDPVDIVKLYPETIQNLETVKTFLQKHLPSAPDQLEKKLDPNKNRRDREVEMVKQMEEIMGPDSGALTRRGPGDSYADEPINDGDDSIRTSRKTVVQLFASRRSK